MRLDMAHLRGCGPALHKTVSCHRIKCAVLSRCLSLRETSLILNYYIGPRPMRIFHLLIVVVATALGCQSLLAESPSEIYQRRVIPLLQSSSASSCSECHLQGIKLDDFLSMDPKASFASLRARGWIDIDNPSDSKLLQFIAKKPEDSTDLMDQVRKSELEGIGQWIRASVVDPELLDTPLPELNDLKLDEKLIRHARKDHVVSRFVDIVWSQLERCANCHSPDRNAKQVEKNGEQMSWIVPNSPSETLQLLEDRSLINLENPMASFLRTKALGQDEHGGGIKFPLDGHTDREWSQFLRDYAAVKSNRYDRSRDIPNFDSIRTWRTGLHLRIKELPSLAPGQYAVILMHRITPEGNVEKDATAIGEGRVSKDGSSWSTSMMLLEPSRLRHTQASVDWKALLPDSKYELRWIVVDDSSTPVERILAMYPSMRTEIDSLWKTGHSAAKTIAYGAFKSIDTPQ